MKTPKPNINKKKIDRAIDGLAAFLAYVALIVCAAYGLRKLFEHIDETAAYVLTAAIVTLLVYIIYRNR